MQWSTIAAVSFGFYLHGLTFYFVISSLAGVHSAILTAVYQSLTIGIPFLLNLLNPDTRTRMLRFGTVELLYLIFAALFLYDYYTARTPEIFPENLIIYASLYWFALMVARSLSFDQLKTACYTSNRVAVVTALLLMAQVATGTASWGDHGTRLVAGAAGNPIIVGHTGAYAFLTCLILWLKAKPSSKAIWLGLSVPGLMVAIFSGTRSATLAIILGVAIVAIYVTRIITQSGRSIVRATTNITLILGMLLSVMLLVSPLMATPGQSASMNAKPSPITVAIENGSKRIDALFQILSGKNAGDSSIRGREGMFQNTFTIFMRNPLVGIGLYSLDATHNAFLQVAAEFGILGFSTFVAPFLYIVYRIVDTTFQTAKQVRQASSRINPERFIRSDFSVVTCFMLVLFVQAVCLYSFHGDPYRNFLPICSTGVLLAYLRSQRAAFRKSV
ncbi:O-antigen ligase family protein [Pseudanabaenaceae cyanobacterium LEGE 13415]|nr:O-antigen ligase family protein [Pseudanabaenaceae cyanobacterium LEGE 13415]